MNCTSCGSEQTRKFSVVYEDGTTTGKSESLSGNEVEHFTQTPLAKKCSPPEEPSGGGFLFAIPSVYVGYKVGTFFGGFGYGLGGFLGSMLLLYLAWQYAFGNRKRAEYESRLAEWQRSWACLKCGSMSRSEPGA